MTIGPQGQNLVLLISQPRAGSTLLQLMLGKHPEIQTLSEPWILLHPLYALRERGAWAEYDQRLAWVARQEFLQALPQGDEDYYEGLRQMCVYLYNQALAQSGRVCFLDKTPRYFHIIPELHRLFPEAHMIFLLRNPLAVLCSVLRTWTRGRWFLLHRRKHDLLEAPRLMVKAIRRLGDACSVVHYEELTADPSGTLATLCARLGLEALPEMVEYGSSGLPAWRHGDHVGVDQHTRPAPQVADRWVSDLGHGQVWRLAKDYLDVLGRDLVEEMGYSHDELTGVLSEHRPWLLRRWFTYPLSLLVHAMNWTERCQLWEHRADRVIALSGEKGLRSTLLAVARGIGAVRENPGDGPGGVSDL